MLHDHHFHPIGYAEMVNGLELSGHSDLGEVMSRVADWAERVDGAIMGQRFNEETLTERRLPTRADLDDAVGNRPVLLYRSCGHIAVANSAALALAGVGPGSDDPPGGSFDRDPSGRPTGVLRETAISLVSSAVAPLVQGPSDRAILDALAGLVEMGLGSVTGIVSADEPLWCGVDDELEALCRLAPELPIDIDVLVIAADPEQLTASAEKIRRTDGRIRFLGWKDFSDGSFGGHTAALHQPFSDRPDSTGMYRLDHEHATTMARAALGLGGAVAIHAIGDRANDGVLDLFEALIEEGADPGRLRVEHASLLTGEAVERMARLRVTASVQPAFIASESDWLVKRLGEGRMGRVYPFRSLLEAGVPLIGGSDAPVELPDPKTGIQAAIDRPGFPSAESLTPDQAWALFAPP